MSPGIFVINEQGGLVEMALQPYEAESVLQQLLADHPGVLAGENEASRRKFALIKREAGVPSYEGGPDRWSLDHLFVDNEGVPTFVEVKRSSDSRIRREVVGQMLDYAANGLSYWDAEALRQHFEDLHQDPSDVLRELVGEAHEADAFWDRVRTNLAAKKVRLVFVADTIPPELRALIEFLNEQMRTVEVLGLEVKQYSSSAAQVRTLVATTIGMTQAAQEAKGERAPTTREMQYRAFWEQFLPKLHATHPGWSRASIPSVVSWLELPAGRTGIAFGVNFTGPGRIRAEVYLYRGKEMLPPLMAKKSEIETAFGQPLEWEELPDRVASRVAIYRKGDVANTADWPEYTDWLLENVGRLRAVFQPHIAQL